MLPDALANIDLVGFTRHEFEPMVRGLFPRREQQAVLALLQDSVVVLTSESIQQVIRDGMWLTTVWTLVNAYLASINATTLSEDAPSIVGLSEETTCYVTIDYFEEADPFADYVVHEAAHLFHNCKRETVGLPSTRKRERLLDIVFSKREKFAYACEAYSRILELSWGHTVRLQLLRKLAKCPPPPDDRVDEREYLDILAEAVNTQFGWKRILKRGSPPPKSR